jgi:uncharacterized protein YdhG (YjbR/CyaY superfamily)
MTRPAIARTPLRVSDLQTVDEYIDSKAADLKAKLELVREAIRKALPNAEEAISYKMPAYKLDGEVVLYFAVWKRHYSLYPAGPRMVAALKDQLVSCELGKGTIRFPFSAPVPTKLIANIAKFRMKEMKDRVKMGAIKKETNSLDLKVERTMRRRAPGITRPAYD